MKESEYIIATNLVKLRMVRTILGDVLPGEGCGISEEALRELCASTDAALGVVRSTLSIETGV